MDKLDRLIEIIRYLKEDGVVGGAPTNNASSTTSSGNPTIAGLPPDPPPGRGKKSPILARGLMPGAHTRWKKGLR